MKRFVASALFFATLPLGTSAETLPTTAPIPYARPAVPGSASTAIDEALKTATIRPNAAGELSGQPELLREGLQALSQGRGEDAVRLWGGMSENRLERRVLAWAIALSGNDTLSSTEIAEIMQSLSGWPGMLTLQESWEHALYRETPSPQVVVEAFGRDMPRTYEGVALLARSQMALGNVEAARTVLSPFWRVQKLEAGQEMAIVHEFGAIIPRQDHRYRMERMLYENRVGSAERVAGLAGGEELVSAWAAVIRNESNAGKLLEGVPEDQRSAGYIFAKARFLRRRGHYREAAAVMLQAPREAFALIDPDEWWVERRALSRELLDIGEPRTAYRIAAAHSAESPAEAADAEFHAGWYALRALGEARVAATHFARIAELAEGPISNARAHYWLGRAAEAGGPGMASAEYARAAQYGTTFYGQLANARLRRSKLVLTNPEPTVDDRRRFSAREEVRAIALLERAGFGWRAASFYRALSEKLESSGELALLARMAESQGDHRQALRVGKIAAGRGLEIGALAHPVGAIPASASIPSTRQALAYAIARQESEFNAGAVSPAGARGLLQLLPGTAREMARKTSLPYSSTRLTGDAAYNAVLGLAYLDEQIGRFGGSYILTFAGYNAGPRRASEWAERYGDPRGKDIETIVDWIERIPYTETRNYVQRVMENYVVYKMRFSGRFEIEQDLAAGK